MKRLHLTSALAVALVIGAGTAGHADERPAPPVQDRQDQEPIEQWVAQLGHERLSERVKAEKKLVAAGKDAIPALAKAALSGKRDTIEKSIDVLGKLAQSKDQETKEAARITLQMLSESDQPSTAERARIALNTKQADGIRPFEGWDKPGNPFAGGGRVNRSISVSNVNGLRTISVREGNRETTIQELQGGKIFAQVRGGEEPVELLAANAEELKEKLPEAAALLEQYSSGNQLPGFGNLSGFSGTNTVIGNQAVSSNITIQSGGSGRSADGRTMLVQQLTELKERMNGNPAMQQLLDQQIQAISGKE